jgi:NAD(P)-dependent dehydrogenase (short-subunit alcohol dehydrogenase family)
MRICPPQIGHTSGNISKYAQSTPLRGNALAVWAVRVARVWAQFNIQANSIEPGYIMTDMNKPSNENAQFDAWVISCNPAQRWGKPDELVGTAIYLASEASNYVNGQFIYVDGGWLSVNTQNH